LDTTWGTLGYFALVDPWEAHPERSGGGSGTLGYDFGSLGYKRGYSWIQKGVVLDTFLVVLDT
jgi:hypothetical protein